MNKLKKFLAQSRKYSSFELRTLSLLKPIATDPHKISSKEIDTVNGYADEPYSTFIKEIE